MDIGEFDLIRRWFTRPAKRAALGVGDDCALLDAQVGTQLAVSTDMLVEGRHFLPTMAADALGHKALAVNLSDLAACGARPLAFTLALSLPRVDEAFLDGFARGLLTLADEHDIDLVGGDTTAGPLNICITVFGEVPRGQALLRSGAHAGDDIWVSGRIGDARLALEAFRGNVVLAGDAFVRVRRAMERPQPRIALGLGLRGVASAAIDLSDGLIGDLGHVLEASRLGAEVEMAAIARSEVLASQPEPVQRLCLLAGGDDYELLFTAPPDKRGQVLAAGADASIAVTRIGVIRAASGLVVRDAAGTIDVAGLRSFDHFAP